MNPQDVLDQVEQLESQVTCSLSNLMRTLNDIVRNHVPSIQLTRVSSHSLEFQFVARCSGYDQWSDRDFDPPFPAQEFVPAPGGIDIRQLIVQTIPALSHYLDDADSLPVSPEIAEKVRQDLVSWWY